jgi:replicative DNA helicase
MNTILHAFEQDDVTRALPHALGPEKSLLSSMLQDPQDWIPAAIEEKLTPAHFYLPSHALLFETLLEIFDAGREIEFVSLTQWLLDHGRLDRIGGPGTMADLYTYAPTAGHFRHHLALVKDKFLLREIIRTGTEAIASAYDAPGEASAILDATEAAVMAIRDAGETGNRGTVKDAVNAAMEEMRQLIHGERESLGLATGFQHLDAMAGGMEPGEVFVVAARPSMGKTAFMLNIVEHVAIEQGFPVMVFSCEMSRDKLVKRLVHTRARISMSEVKAGFNPVKADLQRIHRAALEVARAPLFIEETEAISITALRAKARRHHRKVGLRLIAIDYLQLLTSRTKQALSSREREISEISAGIKALAKELRIPIILLAQLNRGPESRGGKTSNGIPRMSDLRESGSIEQDADKVGLLYRSAYYAETDEARATEAGQAEIIIAKNRNGETGSIPMTFIEKFTQFREGAPIRPPSTPTAPKGRFD